MNRILTASLCSLCAIVAATTTERAIADGEPLQRPGVVTSTVKQTPPKSPQSIEERLAALEKRVEELEKGEVQELKNEQEDDAREKKLEARLAALEKVRQSDNRSDSSAAPSSAARSNGPLTVRAPFIVQDVNGATILEIGIARENNQPELVLGDRDGARARLGVTRAGGASIGLYDSANMARLAIVGNPAESLFRLGGRGQAVDMATTSTSARIHVTNSDSVAVVNLESRNDHGHFTLGNAEGVITVEAATLRDSGVGVVRVGPDMGGTTGAMAGGVVVPRAIRGRKAP